MKILLVDDSKPIAMVFSARLKAFGHEVFTAENGQVAVQKFQELAPDLILMDIEMPVMDGFEATNRIRQFETSQKWAWTPIIFLTSADTTENFVTSINAGGDDLIPKKVPDEVLHAKLNAMARVARLRHELLQANQQMEQDIQARRQAEAELSKRLVELTELNEALSKMQTQLIQSEKLASIGQLAAGVAHEINTPIGFVLSNLGTLGKYLDNLTGALAASPQDTLQPIRAKFDLDYIEEDAPLLIRESKDGIRRVGQIVQSLKDFSDIDNTQSWQASDLHQGLDATVEKITHEFKDTIQVVREYGELPKVECLPAQINQVFLNILMNACLAVEGKAGVLTIRTALVGEAVQIDIIDNGCGIPEDIQKKIFDPFFTTRPVGKGAGLGLFLAYGITRNHGGQLDVESKVGQGACFRITLPIKKN